VKLYSSSEIFPLSYRGILGMK